MKKSRYTDEQIAFALKQAETGTPVKACGPNAITTAYKRRSSGTCDYSKRRTADKLEGSA